MVGGSEHHSLYADPRQHPQKEESVLWTRNGGDRVEAILRNVDHAFAYKAVHASRGKLTQVEPIAALYEQHRVHHIGTFGMLLGGANNSGTIFKISLGGTLTTLYSFCAQPGCTDGTEPTGGLLQATNGILYGTTSAGGTEDYGTVFSLAAGLNPFVESLPTTGEVGTKVTILRTNLTRATGVNFNGTAAAFAVVSSFRNYDGGTNRCNHRHSPSDNARWHALKQCFLPCKEAMV
jgi:uncharacterized repeat protein (TIGR03803 family)